MLCYGLAHCHNLKALTDRTPTVSVAIPELPVPRINPIIYQTTKTRVQKYRVYESAAICLLVDRISFSL